MTFFEYACDEINKTYKKLGHAGIWAACKVPGGYAFSADYGSEYDGKTVYEDNVVFAFEKNREICQLDWRTDRYKKLMDAAVLIDVPDRYLSERRRKKNIT